MRKYRRLVKHIQEHFGLTYLGKRTYIDAWDAPAAPQAAPPGVNPKQYYHVVTFTGLANAQASSIASAIQAAKPRQKGLFHICHIINDPFPMDWDHLRAGKFVERPDFAGPMFWCDRCGKSIEGARAFFMKLAIEDRLAH